MINALHHLQLAMPRGREDDARAFYCGVLGFHEVPKPAMLKGRGGVWFETESVQLHLGVEDPFLPAKKAHPAFRVSSLAETTDRLGELGVAYRRDVDLPAFKRVFIDDPFGNRIELLEVFAN